MIASVAPRSGERGYRGKVGSISPHSGERGYQSKLGSVVPHSGERGYGEVPLFNQTPGNLIRE